MRSPVIGRRLKYLNRRQTIEHGPDNKENTDIRTNGKDKPPYGQEAAGAGATHLAQLTLWELPASLEAHKNL